MLLPCTDNLLRNITLDRPSRFVGRYDSLPYDIERALCDILEKEVDLMRRLDTLRRDLEIRFDYSTLACYRSIDRYNDGRINTFNMGTTLDPEHYTAIGRGWKEGLDYFRVEPPIVCHDGESIQVCFH